MVDTLNDFLHLNVSINIQCLFRRNCRSDKDGPMRSIICCIIRRRVAANLRQMMVVWNEKDISRKSRLNMRLIA